MKIILFSLIISLFGGLLLIPNLLQAQQEIVTYRKNNEQIVKDKDSADYIRIIKPPQPGSELPQLVEYFPNQQLKKKGNILDANSYPKFQGPVIGYYENGQKRTEEFFDSGQRVGEATYYYQNGQLKKTMKYGKKGSSLTFGYNEKMVDTLVNYYDSLGTVLVANGNGYVKEMEGEDYEEGTYREGIREGEWTGTFRKQQYAFSEQYDKGIVLSGISRDTGGKQFTYTVRESPPEYIGGINKLMQFIGKHYRYPPAAIESGVQGTLLVSFVVDNEGKVTDIEIKRDLGHGTGEAAVKTLKSSPKWTPGYTRGIPVRVSYVLPIRLNTH
ncbi:energy transducer TonB [Parapedobacter tibetensis]|uniref:energy transducer TonB n=1 Tax=Parapedobacter tibetensis TaxID=2972951 RepID=UPI00214D46AE|nr:energy transducer TonB [Parapedobacter tibetensis]